MLMHSRCRTDRPGLHAERLERAPDGRLRDRQIPIQEPVRRSLRRCRGRRRRLRWAEAPPSAAPITSLKASSADLRQSLGLGKRPPLPSGHAKSEPRVILNASPCTWTGESGSPHPGPPARVVRSKLGGVRRLGPPTGRRSTLTSARRCRAISRCGLYRRYNTLYRCYRDRDEPRNNP